MRLSSETKANAAFIAALLILCAVGLARYFSATNVVEQGRWVAHTHEVIAHIEHAMLVNKSAESSERAYKLTHDQKYAQEVRQAQADAKALAATLRKLTSDNPHQAANLDLLDKHLGRYFEGLNAGLGGNADASPLLLDAVLDQLQLMKQQEEELLKVRQANAESSATYTFSLITLATVVSMIVLVMAMVMLNRDIRARQKAELERDKFYAMTVDSEKQTRLVIDCAYDANIWMDTHGIIVSWNRQAELIFGLTRQDALGRRLAETIIPPQFREAHEQGLRRFLETGEGPVLNKRIEVAAMRQDGREFPAELTISHIQTSSARFFSAFIRDISERKKAEAELQLARDGAMESARLKSEFLANMSHEIRTPLNGVIGMSELLINSPLAPREREYALTVRNSAESLLTILNDILDLSKIEAGKLTLERVPFNLQLIVEEIGMLIAARASEKKLELIVRYAPTAPKTFLGDPVRIRQVLSNLASNAVKFTQQGHVLISVTCASRENGKAVMKMSVEDTGIGISEDFRTRLFQKFSQADASTTREFGGTGLGLAISKDLVEMMGGIITVSSTPGRGTLFAIELPLPESTSIEVMSPAKVSNYAVNARCLVVDDNSVNRTVLQEQLAVWGVPVCLVEDGPCALAELRRAAKAGEEYSVAILDYQMPLMNGEQLARQIKADPAISGTELIMLSSIGETFTRGQLQSAGILTMLHKPVRQSDLFNALQKAWRQIFEGEAASSTGGRPAVEVTAAPELNLRVLLVEDNDVNRAVAAGMLKKLSCDCIVAVDGQEALVAVGNGKFDAVLMDCQMPVMDGYMATQEIRKREQQAGGARLPIIAMTANAMKGDRERCLDAGMDDYLPKPVRLAQLAEVLARASGRGAPLRRRSKPATPTVPPAAGAELDSIPILDIDAAMRIVGDDAVLLKEVVRVFSEDAPRRIAAVKEALTAGDKMMAERNAHSLKGASGNVGGERLRQVAYQLECACRDNDVAQAGALVLKVESELHSLCDALAKAPRLQAVR